MKRFKGEIDIDASMDRLRKYNKPLSIKKAILTLQGISTAIIYDGKVDDSEIELLSKWLLLHEEERDEWPISEVHEAVSKIVKDNVVTQGERAYLFNLLSAFADGPSSNNAVDGIYDENPDIVFMGKEFIFTGILQYGKRKKAENAVLKLGGVISLSSGIVNTLNYLIVGDLGNKTWKHSRFGRKIEMAIELRKQGRIYPIIAKEDDFIEAILNHG